MGQVCVTSIIPDVNSILASLEAIPFLNFLDLPGVIGNRPFLMLPALPTIPSPMFPSLSMPHFEIPSFADEFQTFQMSSVISIILSEIKNVTSFTLPTIPGTNIDLVSMLSGDAKSLYSAIAAALAKDIHIFDSMLPSPLFVSFENAAIQAALTVKLVIKSYLLTIIKFITNLCTTVAVLMSTTPPPIPTVPTFSSILNTIANAFGVPDYATLLKKLKQDYSDVTTAFTSILAAINTLSVGGIGPNLSSMFGQHFIPEIHMPVMLSMAMGQLISAPLTAIMNFIQNLLGGSFPKLCVTIS